MRLLMIAGTVAFGLSAGAMGQVWDETTNGGGDAPDGVPAAQNTIGNGPLTNIVGATDGTVGDFIDTYQITITDALGFYATTANDFFFGNGTGDADYDTRLWLWDMNGNILLGNDDWPGGGPFHSAITDPRSWPGPGPVDPTANGIELEDGQMYLLSIGGFNDNPLDAAGNILTLLSNDFDALHGPNPAAGAFANWELDGATGNYNIELGGATFYSTPAPGALALLGIAGLAGTRRRRS